MNRWIAESRLLAFFWLNHHESWVSHKESLEMNREESWKIMQNHATFQKITQPIKNHEKSRNLWSFYSKGIGIANESLVLATESWHWELERRRDCSSTKETCGGEEKTPRSGKPRRRISPSCGKKKWRANTTRGFKFSNHLNVLFKKMETIENDGFSSFLLSFL